MGSSIRQEKEVVSFLLFYNLIILKSFSLCHNGMCGSPSHTSQTALQLLGNSTNEKQDTIVALWDTKLANLKIWTRIVEYFPPFTPPGPHSSLFTVVPEMSSCLYCYDLSLPSPLQTPSICTHAGYKEDFQQDSLV